MVTRLKLTNEEESLFVLDLMNFETFYFTLLNDIKFFTVIAFPQNELFVFKLNGLKPVN
jgi:hypothetical protein